MVAAKQLLNWKKKRRGGYLTWPSPSRKRTSEKKRRQRQREKPTSVLFPQFFHCADPEKSSTAPSTPISWFQLHHNCTLNALQLHWNSIPVTLLNEFVIWWISLDMINSRFNSINSNKFNCIWISWFDHFSRTALKMLWNCTRIQYQCRSSMNSSIFINWLIDN